MSVGVNEWKVNMQSLIGEVCMDVVITVFLVVLLVLHKIEAENVVELEEEVLGSMPNDKKEENEMAAAKDDILILDWLDLVWPKEVAGLAVEVYEHYSP